MRRLRLGLGLKRRHGGQLLPPAGFVFVIRPDGTYLTRADGAYLVRAA